MAKLAKGFLDSGIPCKHYTIQHVSGVGMPRISRCSEKAPLHLLQGMPMTRQRSWEPVVGYPVYTAPSPSSMAFGQTYALTIVNAQPPLLEVGPCIHPLVSTDCSDPAASGWCQRAHITKLSSNHLEGKSCCCMGNDGKCVPLKTLHVTWLEITCDLWWVLTGLLIYQ